MVSVALIAIINAAGRVKSFLDDYLLAVVLVIGLGLFTRLAVA